MEGGNIHPSFAQSNMAASTAEPLTSNGIESSTVGGTASSSVKESQTVHHFNNPTSGASSSITSRGRPVPRGDAVFLTNRPRLRLVSNPSPIGSSIIQNSKASASASLSASALSFSILSTSQSEEEEKKAKEERNAAKQRELEEKETKRAKALRDGKENAAYKKITGVEAVTMEPGESEKNLDSLSSNMAELLVRETEVRQAKAKDAKGKGEEDHMEDAEAVDSKRDSKA